MNIISNEFRDVNYTLDNSFATIEPVYPLPISGPGGDVLVEVFWENDSGKDRNGYICFASSNDTLGSIKRYLIERWNTGNISFFPAFTKPNISGIAIPLGTQLSVLPRFLTEGENAIIYLTISTNDARRRTCRDTNFMVNVGGRYFRFPIDAKCGKAVGENVKHIAVKFGRENDNYTYVLKVEKDNSEETYKVFSKNHQWGENDQLEGWVCNKSSVYVLL